MKRRLLLFDIDKTLIKETVLKSNPWKLAFEEVYGINDSFGLREVDTQGKTFRGLAIEGLRSHGLSVEVILRKLDYFLLELGNIYSRALDDGEVLTFVGIKELLILLLMKGFCLGLITGNTKKVAFDKLKKCGIDSFFSIGGFGDDSDNQDNLVGVALSRAEEEFGRKFSTADVFVLGDTPLDISSAKAHNLNTIGVATGVYSVLDLKNSGADYVLSNLDNPSELLEIITKS